MAAIQAGQQVFTEKLCCVDSGGYRSLAETNRQAIRGSMLVWASSDAIFR
jgi:hypothetical protein